MVPGVVVPLHSVTRQRQKDMETRMRTNFRRLTHASTLAMALSATPTLADLEYFDLGRGPIPINVPASYDGRTPVPLVLMLHQYNGTGPSQENYFQFTPLSEEFGFLYTYPTGSKLNGNGPYFWNSWKLLGDEPDDSAYLREVLEYVIDTYAVDGRRIYVVGHSNGSIMANQLACEHADLIAAIAGLAGSVPNDVPCEPTEPVHVLAIHGTNDAIIPFEAGCTPPFLPTVCFPSAPDNAAAWAARHGCDPDPDLSCPPLDLDANINGAETTVTKFEAGCQPGGSSHLWAIEGGSHFPVLSESFQQEVVDFLLDHPKPCAADANGDGELSVLDFVAFQQLWQAGDPGADCDTNAEFNVLDFVCFQQLFVKGCP